LLADARHVMDSWRQQRAALIARLEQEWQRQQAQDEKA
jgi:hypothetical protein